MTQEIIQKYKSYICPNEKAYTYFIYKDGQNNQNNQKLENKAEKEIYTCSSCNFTYLQKTLEKRLIEMCEKWGKK